MSSNGRLSGHEAEEVDAVTEEPWTLRLYCTDRDKHPPQDIYYVEFAGPLDQLRPEHLAVSGPRSMIEMDCPRCPRAPRLRHARMMQLCRWAAEQMRTGVRRVELDASKLGL